MVISPVGILLCRDRQPHFVSTVGYKMSQKLIKSAANLGLALSSFVLLYESWKEQAL